jgi:hypothetical protein
MLLGPGFGILIDLSLAFEGTAAMGMAICSRPRNLGLNMPSTHVPPPKSATPPIQWPACPACGEMLRLITIEPHERYTNLDVRNFACDCGFTKSDAVARP